APAFASQRQAAAAVPGPVAAPSHCQPKRTRLELVMPAAEFHRGRLVDHVHLRVRNLAAAKRFYRAALAALGREPTYESDEAIGFDELWIDAADAAGPSRVHLPFQAADRDAVARFYEAGLAAGGRDNGAPGERSYHPGYYAAF